MAVLKDSLVTGDLRVTGTIYGNANLSSLNASGTGLGTNGQILTSTGTGLAWSSSVAPSSHTHAASDITSGTLAVGRGGTGLTASPSMLTDLGSTTAANVLQASPRPGITGTLGAAHGGTGKTSLVDSANALINSLSTGSSTPTDNDYYVSQYAGGGTSTTTFHRRPVSALWSYIKGKADDVYVAVAGDTMTGALLVGTKAMTVSAGKITEIGNGQTGLFKDGIAISNPTTKNDAGWIRVTGTGESDTVMEIATGDDAGAGEKIVARQYNTSNAVANELVLLNTDGGTVIPKRLTMTSGKPINQILTGSGTAAKDNGASASPRYTPAKWTFNTGLTVSDGDIFTIKIPVAGHTYGIYMSVNNGTNYYPVVANGTGRVTTHYPVNNYIQVIFEASGSAASMTPLAGADAANGSTITGGVFRVLNYYDANTTYSAMSVAEMKTGTATSSRVIRADYLKTFLSTLGGTALTLTHDATNGLVLNHDNYATAGTAGTSSATSGITLAVPYVTYNAQGHITATGTHTHTIPDASTSAKGVIQIGTGADNAAAGNHTHTTSIATDTGTTGVVALTSGGTFKLTSGGTSVLFKMPTSTNNAGTITGVTGSDGLTGSGTSGSVTIKHAAPSTSPAKTTSAVYPITIDKYGHITAAGTAVTIPAAVSVKGDAETSYRTGQVNLTPANLGISATTSSVTVGSTTFSKYSHPTGDGNKHVPATGTTNKNKFLKAGSTAGSLSWTTIASVSNEILTIVS